MNAYNENLRDAVLQSLKSQEKVLKNIKAQANASMFTLYYAQSALITAGCKLLAAQDQVNENAGIKSEAVHNSNLSNNLLAFASQANQYLKQSVTYAGVTAANVQIAASSIVKLAGDIGSIFNIIHAGDFDTDVHVLAKEVNECISATTYDAELASQIGMEASALTAGVQA